jgi:RimJ/RimL family protein N-acetyltransferase
MDSERIYYEKIGGERCYLSPIRVEDAPRYTEWLADPEIAVNLTLMTRIITLPMEREALDRLARSNETFAIVARGEPDRLIGNCGLHQVNQIDGTAECGIFIGDKTYWNRGYGTEALTLLLDFAFSVLNLRNVMLLVFEYNRRAIRCYEKAGFREIGRRRKARTVGGSSYDIVYMDIIADDFGAGSHIRRLLEPGGSSGR